MEQTDWNQWLREYGPVMLLFARQFETGSTRAEDVVQEAFLRFWQFRNSAQDPKAYLFRCVKNCALELRRTELRLKAREEKYSHNSDGVRLFEADAEKSERRRILEAALTSLPEEQRTVVVMKIWGELTFQQIGQALEISPDTSASRYRYAMQALRKALVEEAVI